MKYASPPRAAALIWGAPKCGDGLDFVAEEDQSKVRLSSAVHVATSCRTSRVHLGCADQGEPGWRSMSQADVTTCVAEVVAVGSGPWPGRFAVTFACWSAVGCLDLEELTPMQRGLAQQDAASALAPPRGERKPERTCTLHTFGISG